VVCVEPLKLLRCKQLAGDELRLHRTHCDVLEAEIAFVSKVVGRLRCANDDYVFDADAESPVGIVARFIRQCHASLEDGIIVSYTCPDSLGTFVDVEEVADSVSSTVSIIKSILPQCSPSKGVTGQV